MESCRRLGIELTLLGRGQPHPNNRNKPRVVAEYLRDHPEYDYVLQVDFKDVIFCATLREMFGKYRSFGLVRAPVVVGEDSRYLHHDFRSFVAEAAAPAGPGRGGPLLPVESCFGGLGVYRMACLRACSYGGDDGLEHVEFHRRLRRSGLGRLFLNPGQLVLHSPA